MSTTDLGLDWMLADLLESAPGSRHAVVLSNDGLSICRSPELGPEAAERLAAISSGLQSLAHGASLEFGDGSGGVGQAMVEFHGGLLLVAAAGDGAHLAVVADEDADAGNIGHHMTMLIERIGERLSSPRRVPGHDGTRSA